MSESAAASGTGGSESGTGGSASGTGGSVGARGAAVATGAGARSSGEASSVGGLVAAHLGRAATGLALLEAVYPHWRWADVDAALDGLDEDQGLHGVVPEAGRGLADLLADPSGAARPGPVRRTAVPVSPDEDRWVATNALRLARVRGAPVVVLASYGAVDGGQHVLIQVLAAEAAVARTVLTDLDAAVATDSFLRGRVLTMTTATSASGPRTAVDIDERPGVVADDVVLPTDVLERLEAVVVDPTRDAARVLGCGQPLPRGVLLHGPSGAGMSDAVRYLVSQSPDTTAFLLPGTSLASLPPADSAALVREVMTAAQQLAPTLVVLEDADLVAEDRRGPGDDAATGPASPHGPAVRPALAELLDLLVETDEDADVAVVLTTHRIEALAETLARQPDRLDLVLEVPLPDVVARERLFARAARALPVTSAGIRTAAEAAVATPYAFPARVVRRAVLDAVAADGEVDDARLVATVRALLDERAQLRTAMGAGPVSRQHEAAPETAGSVAEVRGAGDVLAVIRAREAQRDAFGAEGALGGTGLHADGLVHADGLGGESGHDGDDDLGGGGGVDEWIGSSDDVDGDVDDGLSGEDLLDLDLDDED